MIVLDESIYTMRRSLSEKLKRGAITPEEAYRKMLAADPYDHVALEKLGALRRESGDFESAAGYFWRAVESGPFDGRPYWDLADAIEKIPEQQLLAPGMREIALRILLLQFETEKSESGGSPVPIPDWPELQGLPVEEQLQRMADRLRDERDLETPEVAERLRPYRLIYQFYRVDKLDRPAVDAIVRTGTPMVPLLVGMLRGWAQGYLEENLALAENAAALLGEIGDVSALEPLLEIEATEDPELTSVTAWAADRIAERRGAEASRLLAERAPHSGGRTRLLITRMLTRNPRLEGALAVFGALLENLESLPKEDRRNVAAPVIVGALATLGGAALAFADRAFARHAPTMERTMRLQLERFLSGFDPATSAAQPPDPEERPTVYEICEGTADWPEEDFDDEDDEDDEDDDIDDEDDELIPEPVVRPPRPGRNDPCWCGSGKKYKKCHLDEDEQPTPSASRSAPDRFDSLRNRIGNFWRKVISPGEFQKAERAFRLDDPGPVDPLAIGDWLVHDWIPPTLKRPILEEFLRTEGLGLTAKERAQVESWSNSFVCLYEVQEVEVGRGLSVKNLLLGETVFVHDVSLSKQIVRWDGLLVRVVEGERGLEVTGVGLTVPRAYLPRFVDWLKRDHTKSGLSWREYWKRRLPDIRRRLTKLAEEWKSSLRLQNMDGDDLLFSKAVFRISDPARLTEVLDGSAELRRAEDGSYEWIRPDGPESQVVLGRFVIEEDRLTLETNSRARLQRAKDLLNARLGPSLEHLGDEFTTVDELRAQQGEREELPASTIPPEVERAILTEHMEQHYAKWPDTPLGGLQGRTARQAVRTAAGRRQVEALLRTLENNAEREKRQGKPAYDFSRIRRELGLE